MIYSNFKDVGAMTAKETIEVVRKIEHYAYGRGGESSLHPELLGLCSILRAEIRKLQEERDKYKAESKDLHNGIHEAAKEQLRLIRERDRLQRQVAEMREAIGALIAQIEEWPAWGHTPKDFDSQNKVVASARELLARPDKEK